MEDANGRRLFFRRATIATLAGTLATGLGARAWADPGGQRWHGRGGFMDGPMDPQTMDRRVDHMIRHLAIDLDATPEQTARLTEIAKAAAKELRPLREKVREARRRGIELLTAPTIDRAAIERLRAEQIQAADTASRRLSQALADSAEVLTPEQRKKLVERLERRRGWRRG